MEIIRAVKIARREWENIKASLEICGDIGELHSKNHTRSKPDSLLVSDGLIPVRNLIEMENKFPTYGYFTPEAAYVFTALASKAADRLGLMGRLARVFGSGYSLVRTGCLDPNVEENHRLKQMVFFKLFFPIGGGFNWKCHSPLVKVKMKTIFDKFVLWQNNPKNYVQDVRDCNAALEPLWHGL
ncbi:MAG: hypothetical protein ACM3SR_07545 [Ignavibacteriales bacterium]